MKNFVVRKKGKEVIKKGKRHCHSLHMQMGASCIHHRLEADEHMEQDPLPVLLPLLLLLSLPPSILLTMLSLASNALPMPLLDSWLEYHFNSSCSNVRKVTRSNSCVTFTSVHGSRITKFQTRSDQSDHHHSCRVPHVLFLADTSKYSAPISRATRSASCVVTSWYRSDFVPTRNTLRLGISQCCLTSFTHILAFLSDED